MQLVSDLQTDQSDPQRHGHDLVPTLSRHRSSGVKQQALFLCKSWQLVGRDLLNHTPQPPGATAAPNCLALPAQAGPADIKIACRQLLTWTCPEGKRWGGVAPPGPSGMDAPKDNWDSDGWLDRASARGCELVGRESSCRWLAASKMQVVSCFKDAGSKLLYGMHGGAEGCQWAGGRLYFGLQNGEKGVILTACQCPRPEGAAMQRQAAADTTVQVLGLPTEAARRY